MLKTLLSCFELLGAVLRSSLKQGIRWREVWKEVNSIGVGSLPLIIISTSAAGVVLSNEIAWNMKLSLQTVQMIPGFVGQMILREIGIVVPAFLLISKAGAGITAELGSMKITEQLDALKLLKIDRIHYLVSPRFYGFIIASTCLTLIASSITLACAMAAAVVSYNFNILEYFTALRTMIHPIDLACALTKGATFGAVIPLISCAHGFECKGGAQGVGDATTQSVVASTVAVIFFDFVLTYLFSGI